MAKTLISRLDAENIVRAAVDPETHEATGDVYDSVNDVSYPFGGGSSDSNIPMCTVTYVYEGSVENPQILFNNLDMLEPNSYALNPESPYGIDTVSFTLSISENTPVKYLYNYLIDENPENDAWVCIPAIGTYDIVRIENLVNIDENGVITDPSKDSSCTYVLE